MRSRAALIGLVVLVAAGAFAGSRSAAAVDQSIGDRPGHKPERPLNTLTDLSDAIGGCWEWPPINQVQSGMTLTILLSFKRNGEIFGARLTYQSPGVSTEERDLYYRALADMMRRCSPLPFTDGLGNAVAGRPFTFRFTDTRKQKKA
jgi:hypothetical protein